MWWWGGGGFSKWRRYPKTVRLDREYEIPMERPLIGILKVGLYQPWSKLLKGGYIGKHVGSTVEVIKGDQLGASHIFRNCERGT